MAPSRWQFVSQICQAALDRAPHERPAFLDSACGSDLSLRHEVDSLLQQQTAAQDFLSTPASAQAKQLFDRRQPHPYRLFVIVAAVLAVAVSAWAARAVWQHGAQAQYLGWTTGGSATIISQIDADGPAAGTLRRGDRIVAINGDRRVAMGVTWKTSTLAVGQVYGIEVDREGHPISLVLPVQARSHPQRRMTLLAGVLAGLIWCAFAVFIGWTRPSDRTARLFGIVGICAGLELIRSTLLSIFPWLGPRSRVLYGLLLMNTSWVPALAYHAAYRFPPGIRPQRFWTGVLVAGYAGSATIFLIQGLVGVRYLAGPDVAYGLFQQYGLPKMWGNSALAVVGSALFLMTLAVTLRNYLTVQTLGERRRITWIALAFVIATAGATFNGLSRVGIPAHPIADIVTVAVPAAFAYAIVRHHVFDISIAIRIGLQYVLAKNALRSILALPLLLLTWLVVANPNTTIRQIVLEHPLYVVLAAAAGVALAGRARLMQAIDRRFFREEYNRERLLQSILDDLHDSDADEGVGQIRDRLEAALHPTFVQFWFGRGPVLAPVAAASSRAPAIDRQSLELPLPLVEQLERSGSPVTVSSIDSTDDTAELRERLTDLDAALLVPMVGRDGRLRGLLMLGPKRSEEPYTQSDLDVLQLIARQIATAKAHGELLTRIQDDQRIRGDVLGHLENSGISLLKECPRCGACYDGDREVCERDGTPITLSLPVERTIDGRYRLEQLIGSGGMGAVYDATDLRLRRHVAVKLMLGRHFGHADPLRRFEREARAVARLNHPNIIALFDYGTLAARGAFLVMERVEGHTLRTELAHGNRPPAERLHWIVQLLDAVAAAHDHGVIHRDLKPENILLVERGPEPLQVKVLDFGLARLQLSTGDDTVSVTERGQIVGTLAYMAPEQLHGATVDERADIFSLGLITFEVVTGYRLFSGSPERRSDELSAIDDPGSVADARLRAVLARCLATDPAQRFSRVEQLRNELRSLVDATD